MSSAVIGLVNAIQFVKCNEMRAFVAEYTVLVAVANLSSVDCTGGGKRQQLPTGCRVESRHDCGHRRDVT